MDELLKILFYRKLKLVDEYLFKGIQIILLVEDKHSFFIVNNHLAGHQL